MKTLSRIVFALLVASLAAAAGATELTAHRAQYKVKISVLSGQLDTELRATEHGYVARHVIKPVGMSRLLTRGTMDVSSTFVAEPDGVKPVTYHAVDTITDEPETHLTFDWSTNQARGTVGAESVELQLDEISHDNVSIQYELMHDLLSGTPGDRYVLFDVDKMRIANVTNAGARTVETHAGRFEVVGVRHQKEGSSRVTTLWCAPELDYLPVVIEQHRKGKLNFRATLTSYTPI